MSAAHAAGEHLWLIRVYYEDTDAGGVVYYANYLKFMERARTEWLRALGFEQDALRKQGYVFAVRRACADYHRPARFNECLQVSSRLLRVGRASLDFNQLVLRPDGAAVCEARVGVACLNSDTFRPRALPPALVAQLSAPEEAP
jgi:acyl-CoA thioester hydrolase